jgi:DNA-binding CsgD family transcriptional regulator
MVIDKTSHLLLDLYRSARELPIPEFQERALQLFKSFCRFDSALWGVGKISPQTGLAFHAVHLHHLPEEMLAAYEEVSDNDLVAYEAAQRMGSVCSFNLRELTPGRQYADVASFNKRWEMQNLLVGTVYDKPIGSVGFLCLYRAKDGDRYAEDDRLCGEAFLPHLLEAGTLNRLIWLGQLSNNAVARKDTRAIASTLGYMQTHDTEFFNTLRKEWPDWSPPILPRELIQALRSSPEQRFLGKRITVAASPGNGMLFLLARDKACIERLTRAETSVATLVAKGLSYKEAAKRLSLSPATVRNQLHSVYAKLGVGNKVALARRLDEYES